MRVQIRYMGPEGPGTTKVYDEWAGVHPVPMVGDLINYLGKEYAVTTRIFYMTPEDDEADIYLVSRTNRR